MIVERIRFAQSSAYRSDTAGRITREEKKTLTSGAVSFEGEKRPQQDNEQHLPQELPDEQAQEAPASHISEEKPRDPGTLNVVA